MTVEEHKVKYHQEDDHFYNHPERGGKSSYSMLEFIIKYTRRKKCPDPLHGVIIEEAYP